MPQFRIPFGRKSQTANGSAVNNENEPPSVTINGPYGDKTRPSAISIKSRSSEPEEFKLGLVDGNGAFLPPSPPERRSMWKRTPTSTTTTSSHRSMISDNEGFSISRESFDSYRRSFDISASSPVIHTESTFSRQSLDSLRTPYTPISSRQSSGMSFDLPRHDVKTVDEEEGDYFEDVGLEDQSKPHKKSLFSRFLKDENTSNPDASPRPLSSHRGFHLPGRRRGQSGQGAELGDMPRPTSNMEPTEHFNAEPVAA